MSKILNMSIKIVFFDFDWTIFDHRSHSINESTLKGIKELKKNGIKIIINTGRSYYSLMEKEILYTLNFDGFVVSNGGAAIADNKELYAHYLPKELQNEIINFLEENKISYGITSLKKTFGKTFELGNVNKFYNTFDEPRTLDISEYNNEQLLRITYFSDTSFDEKVKAKFPSIILNRFFDVTSEISIKPFIKKEGVDAILNYYGFSKDDAMAFGDDTNDIDMFNAVKYGICVGNGKDELKKVAYYVCEDINDDGIYKTLRKFELI